MVAFSIVFLLINAPPTPGVLAILVAAALAMFAATVCTALDKFEGLGRTVRTYWPFVCLAILWLWCAIAQAEWCEYQPKGAVDGRGMLQEFMSRCPEQGRRQIRQWDKATQIHECTHFIDSEISTLRGQRYGAFYVGGGRCFIVAEPKVTVGQAARLVPADVRRKLFTQYLGGERVGRNVLALFDEWTCYTNDAQATQELKLTDDGGYRFAVEFCDYVDAAIVAIKQHDPGYADLAQLESFRDFQLKRIGDMGGELRVIPPGQRIGRIGNADPQIMDLAPELRELNTDGSCVHISTANLMRWLGLFDEAEEYRARYSRGEVPDRHQRKLDAFGVRYAMTTDGDTSLLEWAIANRRGAALTWSPNHFINLCGRENGQAVLMGNGPRGIREFYRQPWNEFIAEFERQGGWAVCILDGEVPPPVPM